MTFLRIAFRNIFKNRRRSFMTMLSIAFGFMAVVIFKGYTHNSYDQITIAAVFVEGPGHFTVYKKGWTENGRISPEKYMLSADEVKKVEAFLASDPRVAWTAPKLSLSGLATNGRVSTIFLADSIDPERDNSLWKHYPYGYRVAVARLEPGKDHEAMLAKDLARILELPKGSDGVLMVTTKNGQMNATDVTVGGVFPTITEAMDDKYLKIPLSLAQSLYDFDGADKIAVLLKDRELTDAVRRDVVEKLSAIGVPVETRSWDENSLYYQKVKNYLDVVFLFIFSIVMVIVVMSATNTMSMAVYERTREIGTLRAIGLKPRGVIRIFALEGGLLGLFGSLFGAVLSLLAVLLIKVANLTYTPPGIATKVAIKVDLVPRVFVTSLIFFVTLSIISAALPAIRAARQNIVDSLGHV